MPKLTKKHNGQKPCNTGERNMIENSNLIRKFIKFIKFFLFLRFLCFLGGQKRKFLVSVKKRKYKNKPILRDEETPFEGIHLFEATTINSLKCFSQSSLFPGNTREEVGSSTREGKRRNIFFSKCKRNGFWKFGCMCCQDTANCLSLELLSV